MKKRNYLERAILVDLYSHQGKSVYSVSQELGCSEHKVNYWLSRYRIKKRTISEAIYRKNNPKGDPFNFRMPSSAREERLFGLGIGLYWGEGNKADKGSIRIGNSDPEVIRKFMEFLFVFFSISKDDLRFHLHIFDDINADEAQEFWAKELGVSDRQFYKPFIIRAGNTGTYKKKVIYGVATLYYSNTKARNILIDQLQRFGAYGSIKRLPL